MGSGDTPTENELILRIYDTALNPKTWPDLLQDVARFCNARGAFIFEMEGNEDAQKLNAVRASAIFDPKIVAQYLKEHGEDELYDQRFFAARSQMTDQIKLIPDTELDQQLRDDKAGLSVFDRPHMKAQMSFGFKHRAGALLNKDDLYRDRFALQFSLDHGHATALECRRAEGLMPHLAKAISLARPVTAIERQFTSVTRALDGLQVGIAILDSYQRVIYKNVEFARQIDAYDAFRLTPKGILEFSTDRFDKPANLLLGTTGNHGHFGARPRKEAITSGIKDDEMFALCVEIAPLPTAAEFGETTLEGHIVYSLDTSRPYEVNTGMMRQLFDLTRSEAEIVSLLAEGLTNAQVAESRGKSVHTVNTQVKTILGKANAANRTQLIRIATNLSAMGTPSAG